MITAAANATMMQSATTATQARLEAHRTDQRSALTIAPRRSWWRWRRRRNPKLTVIIPVFNKERDLEECLNSILNQTLQDFEIICIDDASFDGSADILARYCGRDQRIRYYRNETNLGPGVLD